MIYLASPYSGTPEEQQLRYEQIRDWMAPLILERAEPLYSPIVHCHDMTLHNSMPTDAASWHRYNMGMLRISSMMWILMLPGYENSKGVAQEIKDAKQLHIPISYTNWDYS